MTNRYGQALREQIALELHHGRSTRVLVNDYKPYEATIRQWIGRETGGARLNESEADELKRIRK